MPLIGYIRVSTIDQNTHLQHDALINYGVKPSNIFMDKEGGGNKTRKALNECISFLRPGDTLVVWKLDRLGRSLQHLIEIIKHLESNRIHFTSLTERMDTNKPIGKLTYHVFSIIAQFERQLIRERIIAGLIAARARGRKGGKPAIFTEEDINVFQKMRSEGKSYQAIADMFNCSRSTIYYNLSYRQ